MDVTMAYWGGGGQAGACTWGGGRGSGVVVERRHAGMMAGGHVSRGGGEQGRGWGASMARTVNVVGRVAALAPERPRCGLATHAGPRPLLVGCARRWCRRGAPPCLFPMAVLCVFNVLFSIAGAWSHLYMTHLSFGRACLVAAACGTMERTFSTRCP